MGLSHEGYGMERKDSYNVVHVSNLMDKIASHHFSENLGDRVQYRFKK
jgi:hypothetical protein